MAQLVRLDSEEHRNLRVAADASVAFAKSQHVMYLRAAEVGRAVCNFPVFCGRDAGSGRWSILGMTSLERGDNLFVEDQQWHASFEPTVMQTYPFALIAGEDGKPVVAFDEDSDALSDTSGEALIDDSGQPSIYLNRIKTILESDIQKDAQSHHFLTALEKEKLLKSIDIIVSYEDDTAQTIIDLYTIDEDRLKSLSTETLGELEKKGYLLTVHAMLISLYQLNALVRRHNRRPGNNPVRNVKLQVGRVAGSAESGQ